MPIQGYHLDLSTGACGAVLRSWFSLARNVYVKGLTGACGVGSRAALHTRLCMSIHATLAAPEGFTKLPTLFTHCAQKTTPTNQLFPGPSARSAGPANQPPGPARVLPGSPTGQKFLRSAYSTRRTSKWVKMGYFTPLQAPRSIFSPLSILKLRHEGHSGLLDALGCQGKEPLRPLRRGRPLRECAKCGTNQPTSGGLECAEWGTTQPTQGPEWVNRVGSLVKPSGAGSRRKTRSRTYQVREQAKSCVNSPACMFVRATYT